MLLTGKRIVIIGGSSGMGLATAKAAVAAGARVVIASRSREKLEKALREIGDDTEALTLDIRDEAALRGFFKKVGAFDHLTTPGNEAAGGPFLTRETAAVRADFDSKFWGQYLAAKYGAPFIRPGGSMVFFAGIYSQRPSPGVSGVAAINSALEGLARGLAVELAPIRVNAVSPGLVDNTPIFDAMPKDVRDEMFQHYAAATPLNRAGQPEEIAQTVLYLMTNTLTTGTTLYVDGGYTLR
ncbi:MAG: SDR family oxidoreductase [Syntrophobacterales bacterium]|jgi:NAD(P)-dependent dehydrogenase (short-subunit alcohol dehydrogenase family)|nr:SDR family oxidoreductase [Syntrophobacterales bacterium]